MPALQGDHSHSGVHGDISNTKSKQWLKPVLPPVAVDLLALCQVVCGQFISKKAPKLQFNSKRLKPGSCTDSQIEPPGRGVNKFSDVGVALWFVCVFAGGGSCFPTPDSPA